jgi:hypothetical protein
MHRKRAILVNIQIMRIFTRLRQMLAGHEELKNKIEKMEEKYDEQFQIVFQAIKQIAGEKPGLASSLYSPLFTSQPSVLTPQSSALSPHTSVLFFFSLFPLHNSQFFNLSRTCHSRLPGSRPG